MNPTLTDQVREKYAWTAREVIQKEFSQLTVLGACCGGGDGDSCCSAPAAGHEHGAPDRVEAFGPSLYPPAETAALPSLAVSAACGCGNPVALAAPAAGEVVVDLGSGSGVDAFLAAQRVGPEGMVYGVDMTSEMVALANSAKRSAGLANVEFIAGQIEALPLGEGSADVVISNCALNLSPDKPAVFAEIARVLRPGGRAVICDVVASDELSAEDRAARGSHVDCIAGALSAAEYTQGLTAAGLVDVQIEPAHPVADRMFAARITACTRA